MAKKGRYQGEQPVKKQHGFGHFVIGMVVYAVIFLAITAGGLYVFWQYMASFENSRPKLAVNAYMDALTAEHICDLSGEVIDSIDHNLESEEECRAYMLSELSDAFTCAKKSAECTEDRQVYMVRCGSETVGQFSIVMTDEDRFGFRPWKLEEDSFDLSYMIGQSAEVTVPDQLSVVVNGKKLDASYVTEDNIPYEELEEYAKDYKLPHRMTYSYGPFLGDLEMQVQDQSGREVVLTEETDYSQYFHNCSEEESQQLNELTEKFVRRYIAFTGCANRARIDNYNNLMYCVVPNSDLADRLLNAIAGLRYAQSKGDKVASITAHHQIRLEEGRYLCDVTYEVDTTGYNGVVRTTTNAKLMFVQTGSELLVEALIIY